MAAGKSLKKVLRKDGTPITFGTLFMSKDKSPLRRAEKKIRMSKKERRRARRKGAKHE
jgi:hypothetical protein